MVRFRQHSTAWQLGIKALRIPLHDGSTAYHLGLLHGHHEDYIAVRRKRRS